MLQLAEDIDCSATARYLDGHRRKQEQHGNIASNKGALHTRRQTDDDDLLQSLDASNK